MPLDMATPCQRQIGPYTNLDAWCVRRPDCEGDWPFGFALGQSHQHCARRVRQQVERVVLQPNHARATIERHRVRKGVGLHSHPPCARINALTLRGGSVLVEVTDAGRRPVPGRSFEDCKPIIGDQYRSVVTWKGGDDIGVPEGTPICLRFKLDQAKIFFLDFE
jgi:hypothetical protein